MLIHCSFNLLARDRITIQHYFLLATSPPNFTKNADAVVSKHVSGTDRKSHSFDATSTCVHGKYDPPLQLSWKSLCMSNPWVNPYVFCWLDNDASQIMSVFTGEKLTFVASMPILPL